MRSALARGAFLRPRNRGFYIPPFVPSGGGGGGTPEPAGIRWRTMTSQYWDYVELISSLTSVGFAAGGLGAASYRNRIAAIEAITSGGVLLSGGGNISSTVASNSLTRLGSGSYTLSASVPLDGKTLVTAPGAQVTIDAGNVDNAVNMRGTGGIIAGVGAGSYLKIINGGDLGIACFDNGDGLCKNNTIYRVWVDNMGGSAFNTTTGTSICAFYNAKNTLVCNSQATNGTDDYTGGNCDGMNGANNTVTDAMNAFIYSNVYRCSDDGLDFWNSTIAQLVVGFMSEENARHPTHPHGDGNGYKCGGPASAVKMIYADCDSLNNGANSDGYGWNRNANAINPSLYYCRQSGDFGGPFAGGTSLYDRFATPVP